MPVSWPKKIDPATHAEPGEDVSNTQSVVVRRSFVYRANWFVLAQTDGEPYVPVSIPEWDEATALRKLDVKRVSFTHTDGNC